MFVVITPRNQSYHMTIVFLVPAALLLPPELLPLIAVVQHVPEWVKLRYPWYIQSFNIANYALDLLAAWATAQVLLDASWLIGDESVRTGTAWLAGAIVFVAVNHVVLAVMLRLARGHTWRTSGLFSFESLSTDLVLATMGVLVTSTWHTNRWLVVLALAPLVLIYRALTIPSSTVPSPFRCSRRRRAWTRRQACSTHGTSPRCSTTSSSGRRGADGPSRFS
jgi:hypothetical protein